MAAHDFIVLSPNKRTACLSELTCLGREKAAELINLNSLYDSETSLIRMFSILGTNNVLKSALS